MIHGLHDISLLQGRLIACIAGQVFECNGKGIPQDMDKYSPHLIGGVCPWLGQQRPEVRVIKQQRLPKALVAQLRTLAYIFMTYTQLHHLDG